METCTENPYQLTEGQAAKYTRASIKRLRKLGLSYLQYGENEPRYYRQEELDQAIKKNIRKEWG